MCSISQIHSNPVVDGIFHSIFTCQMMKTPTKSRKNWNENEAKTNKKVTVSYPKYSFVTERIQLRTTVKVLKQ